MALRLPSSMSFPPTDSAFSLSQNSGGGGEGDREAARCFFFFLAFSSDSFACRVLLSVCASTRLVDREAAFCVAYRLALALHT